MYIAIQVHLQIATILLIDYHFPVNMVAQILLVYPSYALSIVLRVTGHIWKVMEHMIYHISPVMI